MSKIRIAPVNLHNKHKSFQHSGPYGKGCCSMGEATNSLITSALTRSMKKAPINGITRKALGDAPYLAVTACILAMPTGVAPSPSPVNPPTITAAS